MYGVALRILQHFANDEVSEAPIVVGYRMEEAFAWIRAVLRGDEEGSDRRDSRVAVAEQGIGVGSGVREVGVAHPLISNRSELIHGGLEAHEEKTGLAV